MSKYYQTYSKKSLQAISKANYIKQYIIPNQPHNKQPNDMTKILKSTSTIKKQQYFFIQKQQISIQDQITPSLLLNSFKRIYLTNDINKIDSHSFINKHTVFTNNFLKTTKEFQEMIDIVIMEKGASQYSESQSRRSYIKFQQSISLRQSESQLKDYQVYIVHFSFSSDQSQPIKWDTFVQNYVFKNLSDQQTSKRYKIQYSMIFSYTPSSYSSFSILNFVSSTNSTSNFLLNYFDPKKGNQQRLNKLESYLFHLNQLKSQHNQQDSQQKKFPCYSSQLKRQRLIPPQYFMQYKKLKQQIIQAYMTINDPFIKKGQIKDPLLKAQNLVCRFLIEHEYNFQKTRKQLSQQINYQHDLRKKFTLKSFKYWIDQDIFLKIGQDRIGRPVLLFKTYNFFAQKCHDVTDYMNFLFYYIIVQIMSKCKGYIDEMILLEDCSKNTMKNLKIQAVKRTITLGLKHLPRGFFKILSFKCTSIAYYTYALSKPFFPSYADQVICMVKQGDQKEALQECLKHIDIQVIPEVIGGKNVQCNDISEKNISTRAQ